VPVAELPVAPHWHAECSPERVLNVTQFTGSRGSRIKLENSFRCCNFKLKNEPVNIVENGSYGHAAAGGDGAGVGQKLGAAAAVAP
jgi:hypothetical protein